MKAISRRLAIAAAVAVATVGCHDTSAAFDGGGLGDSATGQGGRVVQQRQCGECHQSPNPSDGVLSGQTTPTRGTQSYGSNLTPDPDTGMDAWDADSIVNALFFGVNDRGQPLCPAMPTYADSGMTSDEALAVAVYLQSLTPVRHAIPASTCVVPSLDGGP